MTIKDIVNKAASKWMDGTGPEHDVVISSRVRLARNLAEVPFPNLVQKQDADKVIDGVRNALKGKEADSLGSFELVNLKELAPVEKEILVEKHLISPQHIARDEVGAVALRDDEAVSIMINEEDHLRIQCLLPGFQPEEAWEMADKIDDILELTLDYAFSEKRGYLTSCPTNVGTGLRASVMLHLPAMMMLNQVNRVLSALPQLGLVVRGLYGEGTDATGNLFQISNQITLGTDEKDIINKLSGVVRQIVQQEREARSKLFEEARPQLIDLVGRSLGILKFAHIISSQETMKLLSDLRLGLSLNLVFGKLDLKHINELMVMSRPAFLRKITGKDLDPIERDISRAKLIREKLEEVTMSNI